VLHYTHRWLELSAGFVHDQIVNSRHHKYVLVRDRFENRQAYPYRWVWSLASLQHRARTHFDNSAMLLAAGSATRAKLCHVHFAYAAPDVLDLVQRRGIPFVLSLHGHDASAWPQDHPEDFRRLTPAVSAVIVPSLFLAERATHLGFGPDRIRVIPAGIDTRWFSPGSPRSGTPNEVLFVGRLVAKKGVDVLLAAWARVAEAVPGTRLRVIGDGPMRPLVTSANIPGLVYEPPDPARRRAQVRDAMRAAAVVVTPSRTAADGDVESLLLVNLEAQACGAPVVTTDHGGIPEFVRAGRTALVVAEGEPGALAEALTTVLGDHALAVRMGREGVGWAQQFDVRRCAAKVDDLYDELLN